jgi:3-oxoadipate enol-lactonase
MNIRTSDQLSLYYETHGHPAAPPVMLIHGFGADHEMWEPQIASFPDAGYFVIVPDLRGHGASEIPATFLIADCARDLCDLLNALDLQRAHLVGVSMGGMAVQQFVAYYPERVISQVIVASLSGISRPVEWLNAHLAALFLRIFPPKLQAYLMRNTYERLGHEDVGRYFAERVLHMDSHWLLAARQEVNRFSILDQLQPANVEDAETKPALELANQYPALAAEVIPGHCPHQTQRLGYVKCITICMGNQSLFEPFHEAISLFQHPVTPQPALVLWPTRRARLSQSKRGREFSRPCFSALTQHRHVPPRLAGRKSPVERSTASEVPLWFAGGALASDHACFK